MMALKYVTVFTHLFNLCVVNIQSARNKVGNINDTMNDRGLDFIVFTEFWMKPNDADYHLQLSNLDTDKYSIVNHPRPKKAGGRIAMIFRNKYTVRQVDIGFSAKTFEFAVFNVQGLFSVVSLFQPPPFNTGQDFMLELDQLLSIISLSYNRILLCGDVNLHFERNDDVYAGQFLNYMSDFEFVYQVGRTPTHRLSGSLDVVCTQGLSCNLLEIEDAQLSDHYLIYFSIGIMSKKACSRLITIFPEKSPGIMNLGITKP